MTRALQLDPLPTPKTLTVKDAMTLAQALAKKVAHRPDDVDDVAQTGLLALHRAAVRLGQKRGGELRDLYAFARTVMQRAMWGFYVPGAKPTSSGRILDTAVSLDVPFSTDEQGEAYFTHAFDTDIPDAKKPERHRVPCSDLYGQTNLDAAGEQSELFEMAEFLTLLERRHGPTARRVAENLLHPTDPDCCQHILGEVRAKSQRQQQNGKRRGNPRGVKATIRLSHRLVREALGLSPHEWSRQLQVVREFVVYWLAQ